MQLKKIEAIVLRRVNYGEADRVLTLLSEEGKFSAIAKGARKQKSKLAGGIEIFSVCDMTLGLGKTDMSVLTSARIKSFYKNILSDFDRMNFGYEAIKIINRVSETLSEPEFYYLLKTTFESLDNLKINPNLTELYFRLQLALALGAGINLLTDTSGDPLDEKQNYDFDYHTLGFVKSENGQYDKNHIKLLRLASVKTPEIITKVAGIDDLLVELVAMVGRLEK